MLNPHQAQPTKNNQKIEFLIYQNWNPLMDFVDEKPHKMHERMLEWGE